jgi:hypothetical protein
VTGPGSAQVELMTTLVIAIDKTVLLRGRPT